MPYSILLVDDEQPSVEAMCNGINWNGLGIEHVYTAFNANQARKIMLEHSIDLAICDIEMPQEDGISLVSWIHENYTETVCMLFTCHADFSYAQKSVKIGVYDYILKPAPYDEIEDIIRRAILKAEKQKGNKDYEKTLQKKKTIILSRFMQDLLKGKLGQNIEGIAEQARQWNITVDMGKHYLLLLLGTRRTEDGEGRLFAAVNEIKPVIAELFQVGKEEVSLFDQEGREVVVLVSYSAQKEWKKIKECCRNFIWQLSGDKENKPCLYCAHPRYIGELPLSYSILQVLKRANIAYDGIAYFEDDSFEPVYGELHIDYDGWKELLLRGQGEKLYEAMKQYIHQEVSARRLNEEKLILFYNNFIQLLYSTLMEKHISVKSVFAREELLVKYREKTATVEEMLDYMHNIILASVELMKQTVNKDSIIKKVEEYVSVHLNEEISRDAIAEYVFLNAEYLSRLFHKEAGVSLKEYITNRKLVRAKELFLTTNLQVTEVAFRLGYTNLPHFSKIFKDNTGMTPNEYRKKNNT